MKVSPSSGFFHLSVRRKVITQESSVGNITDEVQSTSLFSLRSHFLIAIIYTGVAFTPKSMEDILCSEVAYKEFPPMNLHSQIK